jgi:hypothetical protein
MASKFRESPHSRCSGLQTPPHLHLGESGQSGLERETGAVCLVIGVSADGIGRPATRAKALNYMPERSRGFESPLPRTKVRGWHNLSCSLVQIRQNAFRRPIRSSEIRRNSTPSTNVLGWLPRIANSPFRGQRNPRIASWVILSRPCGTGSSLESPPRTPSWAILSRPCGTPDRCQIRPGLTSWATLRRPCGTEFVNPASHAHAEARTFFDRVFLQPVKPVPPFTFAQKLPWAAGTGAHSAAPAPPERVSIA